MFQLQPVTRGQTENFALGCHTYAQKFSGFGESEISDFWIRNAQFVLYSIRCFKQKYFVNFLDYCIFIKITFYYTAHVANLLACLVYTE